MNDHHEPAPPNTTQIDAYLDGTLEAADRAAFEQRMGTDAGLRAEVVLQERIDGRLRVVMAPMAAPAAEAVGAPAPLPFAKRPLPAWVGVAAVLSIVGVGVWAAMARPWESRPGPRPALTANMVMKQIVDDGFKPVWVCDDDAKFLAYTKEKLGASFLVQPPQGVQVVGWTYGSGLLGAKGSVLLARAEQEPVIVAMGPSSEDREVKVEPGSGLNVRRLEHRGVVMYEISRLDHTVILPSIVDR